MTNVSALKAVVMMTEENPVGRLYLEVTLRSGVTVDALIVESSTAAVRAVRYNTDRMGGFYTPPTTAELLDGRRVPVYLTKRHSGQYSQDLLAELSPDVVIAGGVGGILKTDVLNIPTLGFLGCHPGLLPRMRGSNPIAHAILEDEPQGATAFWMDEGIDTGPVVYSEPLKIYPDYTYEKIEAEMLKHCGNVLAHGLELLVAGQRNFPSQKLEDGVEYKRADEAVFESVRTKLSQGTYACYA